MLVPRIDINKDGFVEEAELEIWVRHKMQKWTVDEDVDAIFRDLDMNNNDKVTWKEYMTRTFGFIEEGWYLLRKTSTRLWEINPTNSRCNYSREPRTEVYCFRLNLIYRNWSIKVIVF